MNINMIMQQAQKMQKELEKAKKEFEQKEITFTSNGNALTLVMKGNKEVVSINIDKDLIDPDDKEMLEDMLKVALNDAIKNIDAEMEKILSKASGGMNIPGLY